MRSFAFGIVFVFFGFDGIAQEIPAFYAKNHHPVLGDVRDYYLNTYQNLTVCDSVASFISKELKPKSHHNYVLNELARIQILSLQGNKVEPLEQLEKLHNREIPSDNDILTGYYYNVYGSILYHFEKPLEAQENYKLAIRSFLSTADSSGLKGNYINLGNTYLDLNKSDSALYFYHEAQKLEQKGVITFSETLKSNIAQAYLRSGQLDSAKFYYRHLVTVFRQEQNSYKLVNALLNLGIAFEKNLESDSATFYLSEALHLSEEYNLPWAMKKALLHLALTYQSKQHFERALNYYFKYDSLLAIQHAANLEQKIGELELEHQEQSHRSEQELMQEKLENQKRKARFLFITSALILLILLLMLYSYLKIAAKNKALVQSKLARAKQDNRNLNQASEDIDRELINKVMKALKEDKVYLDPKLSLERMAKKLGSNRTYLSKTINSYFKLPFNELIHQHRIDEACVLLSSKEFSNYSIEGIAQTVGYHNLSSFNTAFKRLTGSTPSRFRTSS
ncbi:MAG: AraC family transcriptional regulator [Flavobacteriales bacterium]|nr:AraC family transcriptional regulator [Flavobacteriales bacterium]